jgi:hypothetical protein
MKLFILKKVEVNLFSLVHSLTGAKVFSASSRALKIHTLKLIMRQGKNLSL